MAGKQETLDVYQTGELTVVGFGGREILDQVDLSACRDTLLKLIETHQAKTLAFDLAGVKLIPSGMLGLLASLRRMNVEVHLYNPSPDVLEVLEITKLSSVLPVHFVEMDKSEKSEKSDAS